MNPPSPGDNAPLPSKSLPSSIPHNRKIAAVTGASGFIGSYVCQDLLEHGYTVRACVRQDRKAHHLRELAASERVRNAGGRLEVCVADMSVPGAYDEIFGNGCRCVFHVAGNFGTDYHLWKSLHNGDDQATFPEGGRLPPIEALLRRIEREERASSSLSNEESSSASNDPSDRCYSYDHAVYDSYVKSMEWLLASVAKHADTIERVVYTSSGAAGGTVCGPPDVTDDAGILDHAYGKAKTDCEAMLYGFCQALHENRPDHDLRGLSVCPCIVLGPLMGSPPLHDTVYPHRWSDMLRGRYTLEQWWEVTDVRDVATTHRLAAEATHLANGTRFWNGSEGSTVSRHLEVVKQHPRFAKEERLVPVILDEGGSESESEIENDGDDDNKREHSSRSKSEGGETKENQEDNPAKEGSDEKSSTEENDDDRSCSSEDSYGISEWDEKRTTTWSDPIQAFADYQPRSPEQTIRDTTASLLERWEGLGRELTLDECSAYYTVAEMDGCDEEMEWLANVIRTKRRSNPPR